MLVDAVDDIEKSIETTDDGLTTTKVSYDNKEIAEPEGDNPWLSETATDDQQLPKAAGNNQESYEIEHKEMHNAYTEQSSTATTPQYLLTTTLALAKDESSSTHLQTSVTTLLQKQLGNNFNPSTVTTLLTPYDSTFQLKTDAQLELMNEDIELTTIQYSSGGDSDEVLNAGTEVSY